MGGGSEKVGSPGAVGRSGVAGESAGAVALSPGDEVYVDQGDGSHSEGTFTGYTDDGWVKVDHDGGASDEYPADCVEPW